MSNNANPSPSARRWRVLKFGGSSVAEADNWAAIAERAREVLDAGGNAVVVVSALGGVTDLLDSAPDENDPAAADSLLAEIRGRHERLA
ncbi:MAG: hypothetical protein RQ847_10925, partial [Wenzhouxiangellaceae bacterium]|nr:hypothetical protein [Wenzhouxiangellaceae bacterium]